MKTTVFITGILGFALLMSGAVTAGDLNASSTAGVIQLWDQQPAEEGDLVQLIWAGPDGQIDPPDPNSDPLGAPTGDDEFIRDTFVGNGYLAGYAEGRFDKLFTHSEIQPDRYVYIRAWDTATITSPEDSYGDSELYQVVTADEFEAHDFGTIEVDTYLNGETHPVELSSFSISSVAGRVVIEWTTQSETENLGFHIYKSATPNGQKQRVTKEMIKGALNSETRHDYRWEEEVDEDQVFWYWLADVSTDGSMRFYGPKRVETVAAPEFYTLEQNYPNPFNPTTTITFALKEQGKVYLAIYNLRGQVVRELVNEERSAGSFSVEWDGLDTNGFRAPSGLYFYSIRVNDFNQTKKMALTK